MSSTTLQAQTLPENSFHAVLTDSPVTTLLLRNYLFKIMDFFETDYAVFLWKNEIMPSSGGMAVGSSQRMNTEALEMLRGIFWLHFDIARGEPSFEKEGFLIKEFYSTGEHGIRENTKPGDYHCLDLFRHQYMTSMAGAGYLTERPPSIRFTAAYKPEPFLIHSAVAIMRRF